MGIRHIHICHFLQAPNLTTTQLLVELEDVELQYFLEKILYGNWRIEPVFKQLDHRKELGGSKFHKFRIRAHICIGL